MPRTKPTEVAATALAQCQRLARGLCNLGGHTTATRLARRVGVSVDIVFSRLRSRGAHGFLGLPALFAYDRLHKTWGVTTEGRHLARAAEVPGLKEAFKDCPPFMEAQAKSPTPLPVVREIVCPTCRDVRLVSLARSISLARYPHLPRICHKCSARRRGDKLRGIRGPVEREGEEYPIPADSPDAKPSTTTPGSPERMELFARRARLKMPLVIPGDAGYWTGAKAERWRALADALVGRVASDAPSSSDDSSEESAA